GIQQYSITHEPIRPIGLQNVEPRVRVIAFGRACETDGIADAFARNNSHEEPTIIGEPSKRHRARPVVGYGIRRLYRRCEGQQSSDHGLGHVVTPSPTGSVQPPIIGGLHAVSTISAGRPPPETFSTRPSCRARARTGSTAPSWCGGSSAGE